MKLHTLKRALSKSNRIAQLLNETGVTRFEKFQQRLLTIKFPAHEHLLLCLFAFDGLRVSDFKKAILSKPMRYEGEKIGLGWVDESGRQQRIQLGSLSLKLLSQTDWTLVQDLTLNCIVEHYQNAEKAELTLQMFTSDQFTWFSEIASGPLVDHFQGFIPMTALSDDCYARLITKQALFAESDDDVTTHEEILYRSLEGWLEPQGEDKNPTVVNKIVKMCGSPRVDDRQGSKARLLEQCQITLSDAMDAGPLTSLILAWVCHLILNGTERHPNIAFNTLRNYVSVLAESIFFALRFEKFDKWELPKFEDVYDELMSKVASGSQKNMASAIKSWHHFLVGWLDVPPLRKQYHDEIPVSIPLANVLWAHEYELIQTWLTSASIDPRLKLYLKAMFSIAFRKRLRINELLKLRVEDVNNFNDIVQINIRGTKSPSSKRRIELELGQCPEFTALVRYRQNEHASFGEYLFGDPNKIGKIYSLSKLYTYASHLLKSATGDPSIRFHSLSHTVVSSELISPLVGGTDSLTNSLHQLGADFAHYSILTSCSEYMHRYEDSVRMVIDRAISDLKISYQIAERWSGKTSSALRKQASRNQSKKQEVKWQAILLSTCKFDIKAISDSYKVIEPSPPQFLKNESVITLSNIISVFADLQKNYPLEVIALRQYLTMENINNLLLIAKKVLSDCSDSKVDFSYSKELVVRELQNSDWLWFAKALFTQYQSINKTAQINYLSCRFGIEAWLRLIQNGYLSLTDQVSADKFLKMLATLEIPGNHLAIAHTNECDREYLRMLQACFFEYFHLTVPSFVVSKRGGRPSVYLLFSSQRIKTSAMPAAAALATSGMHAILFSLAVLLELKNER